MHIAALLRSARFTSDFVTQVGALGEQDGYMVVLDDLNLLRYVMAALQAGYNSDEIAGPQLQSLTYTHLPLEALDDSDNLKSEEDRKTVIVGPGVHKFQSQPLWLVCEVAEPKTALMHGPGGRKISYRSALVSPESLKVITDFVESVRRKQRRQTRLIINVVSELTWREETRTLRPRSTLYLGPLWDNIYQDVQRFFKKETKLWYATHGIPYVRCLVFHGPPGCGKSACLRVLASMFGVELYSLPLTMARLDDSALTDLIYDVAPRSIVAIEDIDRVFNNFHENESMSSVSFSTLLNIMDGTLSREEVVFVLTCNHYDRIDDTLKRCGRVDRVFEFPYAKSKTLIEMFQGFYPSASVDEAKAFASKVGKIRHLPLSVAQEFFIQHQELSATEAVAAAKPAFFQARLIEGSAHHRMVQ